MKISLKATLLLAGLTLMAASCGKKVADTVDGKTPIKVRTAKDGTKKKSLMTPGATGSPYEVLVVADSEDFQTGAYDSLFNVLNDDIPGLPQPECHFRVSKVTTGNFSKNLRYCRNIIEVKIDKAMYTTCKMKFRRDVYSTPQIIMTIQAPDAGSFCDFVTESHDDIISFFTRVEMNREADFLRNDHNPVIQEKVKEKFGCDVWVPTELSKTKNAKGFFWASTDRGENDMNFVIYAYPYTDPDTFTEEFCISMRDSVMKANIPGPREGQYMMTSRLDDMPLVQVYDSEVHGEYAQIARGLWNIRNYDMGGPFVSVSRVDEKNGRVIVVEGFVFAPNGIKKNLMRRMEAALYTLRLPEELETQNFQLDLDEITISPED